MGSGRLAAREPLHISASHGERHMRRALALARDQLGRVSPRPAVGAVVVREGQVVAEGATGPGSGPHAERSALDAAAGLARGADLYVTLEPCAHFGQTPPCTQAIVDAGIARVFAAVRDPNPVSGDGVESLRAAGVEVQVGLLNAEAAEVNQGFFKWIETGRPYVTAKWAMSLDGKIATRTGHSKYISGEQSLAAVHQMRRRTDALLVGIGTVLADDPLLTDRSSAGAKRQPLRAVLDSQARTSIEAKLVAAERGRALIFVGRQAHQGRVAALRAAGAEVVAIEADAGGLDLGAALDELAKRDVLNVLVEGGGAVLGSFFDCGLVDRVEVFVAPVILGGGGAPSPVGGLGLQRLEEVARPLWSTVQAAGADSHITSVLRTYGPRAA